MVKVFSYFLIRFHCWVSSYIQNDARYNITLYTVHGY